MNGLPHAIAGVFPSSFDWGSFWGGVIGSCGAFGAAFLVYWLQYRPSVVSKRTALKLKASRTLGDMWRKVDLTTNTNLHTVLTVVSEDLIPGVSELIIMASEVDRRSFKAFRALYQFIFTVSSTISTSQLDDPDYMKTEASITQANAIKDSIKVQIDRTANELGFLKLGINKLSIIISRK